VQKGTINPCAAEHSKNYRYARFSRPTHWENAFRVAGFDGSRHEESEFCPLRETQKHEEDLSRMSDEGCPNDPVLSLSNEMGIEGACNTLGQILDHPKSLGLGANLPQPPLDLVGAVRSRLSTEMEEKSKLANDGGLIASIVA
jgi:hypothetical protein